MEGLFSQVWEVVPQNSHSHLLILEGSNVFEVKWTWILLGDPFVWWLVRFLLENPWFQGAALNIKHGCILDALILRMVAIDDCRLLDSTHHLHFGKVTNLPWHSIWCLSKLSLTYQAPKHDPSKESTDQKPYWGFKLTTPNWIIFGSYQQSQGTMNKCPVPFSYFQFASLLVENPLPKSVR